MLVGMIERQINNITNQYNDTNYFPDEFDTKSNGDKMTVSERNNRMNTDYEVRSLVDDVQLVGDILERRLDIDIIDGSIDSIYWIYDYFISERIKNLSDIITNYIEDNIDLLYNEYRDQTDINEIDKMVDINNDNRRIAVIKRCLDRIVTEALDMNLTEYIPNRTIRKINDKLEIIDNVSPYEVLSSTVLLTDMRHVLNIAENIKINLNNKR